MLAIAPLLQGTVAWRIDAIGFLFGMLLGCAACLNHFRQQGAAARPARGACAAALLLVLAGALLAELPGWLLAPSEAAGLRAIVVARLSILGAFALAGGTVLWAAVRVAPIRCPPPPTSTESELQGAKPAPDQASLGRNEFLAVISHELRTPLNAIMGFANLLRETRLDERQRGYLAAIVTEGERLVVSINDLLDRSRIDGGQLVIESVPFDPAEVIADAMRFFQARDRDRQVDLRFEGLIEGPLLVVGDPLRFRQVLVNLVDNALKFTPKGSVTVFLTWNVPAASAPRGLLSVRVVDTGIGIPSDRLTRLFQAASLTASPSNRTAGGAGIGLATCHRLIGLMGGEISVQSTPGSGTEVKFSLPLPSVPKSEVPALELEAEITFATPPRILVVDDRDTNRFLLEVFLRRHGFETDLASGGEEAVRLAVANRYDAILMDLQMPVVDGYMATARIRASEGAERHTLIIALTASLAKGTRERCLAAGMDEHLIKPLDVDQFRRILSRQLTANAPSRPLPAAVNA